MPNFQLEDYGKISLAFNTHCLEFVTAKFMLNSKFFQLFIHVVSIKNENFCCLYNISKHKMYTVFRAKARICSHENVTHFW